MTADQYEIVEMLLQITWCKPIFCNLSREEFASEKLKILSRLLKSEGIL